MGHAAQEALLGPCRAPEIVVFCVHVCLRGCIDLCCVCLWGAEFQACPSHSCIATCSNTTAQWKAPVQPLVCFFTPPLGVKCKPRVPLQHHDDCPFINTPLVSQLRQGEPGELAHDEGLEGVHEGLLAGQKVVLDAGGGVALTGLWGKWRCRVAHSSCTSNARAQSCPTGPGMDLEGMQLRFCMFSALVCSVCGRGCQQHTASPATWG